MDEKKNLNKTIFDLLTQTVRVVLCIDVSECHKGGNFK